MFSKSILRALAIDGGVGLENPTRLINLLEEFSQSTGTIRLVKAMAGGTGILTLIAGLSGAATLPLVLGLLCTATSLGATLRHQLTLTDERELALLQRHRSLLLALSEIDKLHGTEKTLARYEELITTYSQMDDCFYFGQTRIEAGDITALIEQAIASNAPTIKQSAPSTPKPFRLAEAVKATQTVGFPTTPVLPATSSTASSLVFTPSPPACNADTPLEQGAIAPQGWDADQDDSVQWLQDLLHYPAVLIYGPQGSGKTTLATWLIHQRQGIGHQVEILDPHREYGQWDGFPVYGDGMDYEAIDQRLVAYSKLVASRYKQRAQQPTFNPRPLTYLVEEFTQWHRKCRYGGAFFESSLSDTRKINMGVIFVSHGRTLVSLGGAKGLAETRDNSLLEVELFAQVDPATKKASPTEKGYIKYPGMQPIEITIPNLSTHHLASGSDPSLSPTEPGSSSGSTAELSELRGSNEFRTESELPGTNTEPTSELSQNLHGVDAKSEEITLQERGLVVENVRSGEKNINSILLKVWGVKQGGSKGYAIARKKLDQILKDAGIELK